MHLNYLPLNKSSISDKYLSVINNKDRLSISIFMCIRNSADIFKTVIFFNKSKFEVIKINNAIQ